MTSALPRRMLKPSDLASITGHSIRYWQARIAAGDVPGAKQYRHGTRRVFRVAESVFTEWWEKQGEDITPWQIGRAHV